MDGSWPGDFATNPGEQFFAMHRTAFIISSLHPTVICIVPTGLRLFNRNSGYQYCVPTGRRFPHRVLCDRYFVGRGSFHRILCWQNFVPTDLRFCGVMGTTFTAHFSYTRESLTSRRDIILVELHMEVNLSPVGTTQMAAWQESIKRTCSSFACTRNNQR